jgi:hypothetical protein
VALNKVLAHGMFEEWNKPSRFEFAMTEYTNGLKLMESWMSEKCILTGFKEALGLGDDILTLPAQLMIPSMGRTFERAS